MSERKQFIYVQFMLADNRVNITYTPQISEHTKIQFSEGNIKSLCTMMIKINKPVVRV